MMPQRIAVYSMPYMAVRRNNMEKYNELLSDVAERVARKTAHGEALAVDLECIERILSVAERKIKAADKVG